MTTSKRNAARRLSRRLLGCKRGFVKGSKGRCKTDCIRTSKGRCSEEIPNSYYKFLGVKKGAKQTYFKAYDKLWKKTLNKNNGSQIDRKRLSQIFGTMMHKQHVGIPFNKIKFYSKTPIWKTQTKIY